MSLDLNLTESEEMLKATALDFMKRDAPKEVIQRLQETDTGITGELWRRVVEMGWLGIIIPEQYGGTGNQLTSAGVLFEAIGTGPLPGPYFSSGILGSLIVLEAGTEEQKQQFLPDIAEGKKILTLALTEPDYSWDPGLIQTAAAAKNGDFILDGLKLFIMDAQAATHFIVVARTGKESDTAKGISLFLVDKESEGISVNRLPGFLTGRSFEVKFDSVKVPAAAMLGSKNMGWPLLQKSIEKAIPVLCAYKVGGSQAVFEMALEYSRIRVQFGIPIGRFQRVQDMIINMVTHLDAARWATYEALWKLDTQRPAAESIHLAKVLSSQAYWELCTIGHQVFSGVSYSKEHALSFHTRASRSLYNFLGEPTYHRQQITKLLAAV
ncbi:MAG TPA: acyl-CoA dehydrogenase family protein [Dehalococcoidia bacterium]|nr:acyl-CoA dehydrogenase family protein [Dehalococcoidia bacterium]